MYLTEECDMNNEDIILFEIKSLIRQTNTNLKISQKVLNENAEYLKNQNQDVISGLSQEDIEALESSGGLGKAFVRGAKRGLKQAGFGAAVGLGIGSLVKKIPGLGDFFAFGAFAMSFNQLRVATKQMTDYLIKKSDLKLEDFQSLLGEYSFFELSVRDLNKIAEYFENNPIEEKELEVVQDMWLNVLELMKSCVLNIILTTKTAIITAALAAGTAIGGPFGVLSAGGAATVLYTTIVTLEVLPVERLVKEGLYEVAKALKSARESVGNETFEEVLEFMSSAMGAVPLIGFLMSSEKLDAIRRIDGAILGPRDARGILLSAASSGARGVRYAAIMQKAREKAIEKAIERAGYKTVTAAGSIAGAKAGAAATGGYIGPSHQLPGPGATPALPGNKTIYLNPVPGQPNVFRENKVYKIERLSKLAGIEE